MIITAQYPLLYDMVFPHAAMLLFTSDESFVSTLGFKSRSLAQAMPTSAPTTLQVASSHSAPKAQSVNTANIAGSTHGAYGGEVRAGTLHGCQHL